MNENLNLAEILKDCPRGTKLYSTVFGEVKFMGIKENTTYPIIVKVNDENFDSFTADGKILLRSDGECTLFPSKDQRDWSKFNPKKPKFDPKTLQPFDKVIARDYNTEKWRCDFFSHTTESDVYKYVTTKYVFRQCIPYNDDTKHLIGTTDEAPEFYRYWEK